MNITKGATLAGALGIGAALWYLYDGRKGPARRAALRNKMASVMHTISGFSGQESQIPRAESVYLPSTSSSGTARRMPSMRTTVGSLAGAGLALYGVRKRGPIGRFATGLGATMFRRSAPWRRRPEPPRP